MDQQNNQQRKPGVLRQTTAEDEARMRADMEQYRRELAQAQAELPAIRAEGEAALRRLLPIAQGSSGQCRYVAAFLLSCYNGMRFKFDLTDFRALDRKIFNDCMAVLRMDFKPAQEVHCYFENGGAIFEQLAKDWNIPDYTRAEFPNGRQ